MQWKSTPHNFVLNKGNIKESLEELFFEQIGQRKMCETKFNFESRSGGFATGTYNRWSEKAETPMANKTSSPANTASSVRKMAKSGKLKMSDTQIDYVNKLLHIVISFTTFGASITFGLIVSQNKEPSDPANLPTVEMLIAVSWVLFVVGLLLANLVNIILSACRHTSSTMNPPITLQRLTSFCVWKGWSLLLVFYLVALLSPLTAALLCLATVVKIYLYAVGIAALVLFGLGFGAIFVFSIWYLAHDCVEADVEENA
jgi:hypothetical protein